VLRSRIAGFLRQSTVERSREELIDVGKAHQIWLDSIASGDVVAATGYVEWQIVKTADEIIVSLA
jgi:hypothetical protein